MLKAIGVLVLFILFFIVLHENFKYSDLDDFSALGLGVSILLLLMVFSLFGDERGD